MNITQPKALFFDWDGTLADSFSFIQSAHNHALTRLGFPVPEDTQWFKIHFGRPREKIYQDLYGVDLSEEAQTLFEAFVVEHHTDLLQPLPGAENLLNAAQALGITLGVVSNKRTDFIAAEIKAFGWGSYFSAVVGAGEADEDKPSAAPLRLALARSGLDLDMDLLWYVGDTAVDMACAQSIGCHGVFIDYMGHEREEAQSFSPLSTTNDCDDVRLFLEGICKKL